MIDLSILHRPCGILISPLRYQDTRYDVSHINTVTACRPDDTMRQELFVRRVLHVSLYKICRQLLPTLKATRPNPSIWALRLNRK
jgi:hypothetical protein